MVSIGVWVVGELAGRWRSRGGKTSFDWTLAVVAGSLDLGIGLAVVAVFLHSPAFATGWAPVLVGELILIAGLTLRFWAVLTLGRYFKITVSIQEGHTVVRTGPYRVLRHPSYTGLLLILLGLGLALETWLGLVAVIALPLIGILIRIRVEEAALIEALGQDYVPYAAETRRLIPGVW